MVKTQRVFEEYLKNLDLNKLLHKLGASDSELIAREVSHFTVKEAMCRDEILVSYFGEAGLNRIVDRIVELLFAFPELRADAKVLDVGAGSGFFTVKVAEKVRSVFPKASFYAMDMTPAMLLYLVEKNADVHPFVGLAENVEGSVKEARRYFEVPEKFDAVFSTLMIHHSAEPQKVFQSLRRVIEEDGKAIVVDLCKHSFEEFRKEMGDVHLGFNLEEVVEMARKVFREVRVEKMPGICCKCSGRAAEFFFAYMYGFV